MFIIYFFERYYIEYKNVKKERRESMESKDMPQWYWDKGLHDATINSIELVLLDCDFAKKNPLRNYIIIEIDSRNALFDTSIKAIKFYNAKILSKNINYCNWWWVDDSLKKQGEKYTITIHVATIKQVDTLIIRFDDVEIVRT